MAETDDDPLTASELNELSRHDGPTVGPSEPDVAASAVLDEDSSPIGGNGAVLPNVGDGLAPWSAMLLPLLKQVSGMLERTRPRWAMSDMESRSLAIAWGAVLDKYKIAPAGLEVTALAVTFAYAMPRYLADEDERLQRRRQPDSEPDIDGRAITCVDCGAGFESDADYMDHPCPASAP